LQIPEAHSLWAWQALQALVEASQTGVAAMVQSWAWVAGLHATHAPAAPQRGVAALCLPHSVSSAEFAHARQAGTVAVLAQIGALSEQVSEPWHE